jgi:hypothetical protein
MRCALHRAQGLLGRARPLLHSRKASARPRPTAWRGLRSLFAPMNVLHDPPAASMASPRPSHGAADPTTHRLGLQIGLVCDGTCTPVATSMATARSPSSSHLRGLGYHEHLLGGDDDMHGCDMLFSHSTRHEEPNPSSSAAHRPNCGAPATRRCGSVRFFTPAALRPSIASRYHAMCVPKLFPAQPAAANDALMRQAAGLRWSSLKTPSTCSSPCGNCGPACGISSSSLPCGPSRSHEWLLQNRNGWDGGVDRPDAERRLGLQHPPALSRLLPDRRRGDLQRIRDGRGPRPLPEAGRRPRRSTSPDQGVRGAHGQVADARIA